MTITTFSMFSPGEMITNEIHLTPQKAKKRETPFPGLIFDGK